MRPWPTELEAATRSALFPAGMVRSPGHLSERCGCVVWVVRFDCCRVVTLHYSSPEDSIHLPTDATIHGFSVDDAEPHTRAWIFSLEAEAYTRAGNESGAFEAIDKAQAVLDRAGTQHADSHSVFFDENRLLGERGVTAVRLGLAADGQAVHEQVLDEMDRHPNRHNIEPQRHRETPTRVEPVSRHRISPATG